MTSGPTCVGLAIGQAARDIHIGSSDCRTLELVARELWPDRIEEPFSAAPIVNDHPDTTWADIEVWMEKAAVMREEAVE